jgi:hypothetical protein
MNLAVQLFTNEVHHAKKGPEKLVAMSHVCTAMGLYVWQWIGYDQPYISGGHSSNSFHYQIFNRRVKGKNGYPIGCAFDAYWPASSRVHYKKMRDCARYFDHHFARYLTEGIFQGHRPKDNLSIKNGKRTPASTWGSKVWNEHRSHIHIAIHP